MSLTSGVSKTQATKTQTSNTQTSKKKRKDELRDLNSLRSRAKAVFFVCATSVFSRSSFSRSAFSKSTFLRTRKRRPRKRRPRTHNVSQALARKRIMALKRPLPL